MLNLKDIRRSRNLTAKELGKRVGMSESAIFLYESGKRKPDYELLLKMSDVLDCTLDELMGKTAAEPVSRVDKLLFSALDGATEGEKEAAAKFLIMLKNKEFEG